MTFPPNLKYTKEHEWILIENDRATLGITDFAQRELGEIIYVEVDTVGEELEKDEVFGTVEAVKTTSELYMPLSGEVLEFNEVIDEDAGDNAAVINEAPYTQGWIVRIRISNEEEIDELLDADTYEALVS